MPAPTPRVPVIRNRSAAFGWGFMGIWMGMLAVFSWLFWRDGGMGQFSYGTEAVILAVFWCAGIAMSGYVAGFPLIFVDRAGDRVIVTERRLAGRKVREAGIGQISGPCVVEGTDNEGDPYFRAVLTLPDGHEVTLAERHDRATVEAAAERVRAALGPAANLSA